MVSTMDPRTVRSTDRSVRVGAKFLRFVWSGCGGHGISKVFGPGAVRSLNFIFLLVVFLLVVLGPTGSGAWIPDQYYYDSVGDNF